MSFESTAEAFRVIRARASVANTMQANLLHAAIYDAHQQGLSIREAAEALQVSQGVVRRHWSGNRPPHSPVPSWGNADEYRAAEDAAWAHDPGEADGHIPYLWETTPQGRPVVSSVPREIARLSISAGQRL